MDCERSRLTMLERFDGLDPPELVEHVAACADCRAEWDRLELAEGILRSVEHVGPPPHFRGRVMHLVAAEERRKPAWRRRLASVGVVVSGSLAGLVCAVLLAEAWRAVLDASSAAPIAAAAAEGAGVLASILWTTALRIGPTAMAHAVLVVALALVWFGVLVVPRWTTRGAR